MEYEDSDKMLNKAYKMQEELEREDLYGREEEYKKEGNS